MKDINAITLTGRLGKDPDLRQINQTTAVATFTIAVGEKWKDKQTGEMREETSWVQCEAMGPMATVIVENVGKGDAVLVFGKIKVQSWEKNGVKQYKTFVQVNQFRALGETTKPEKRPATASRRHHDDEQEAPF
jgi:single-strand DNA-binding protein